MVKPRIYADFHNADPKGRLRLNCIGTMEDLSRQQVELPRGWYSPSTRMIWTTRANSMSC